MTDPPPRRLPSFEGISATEARRIYQAGLAMTSRTVEAVREVSDVQVVGRGRSIPVRLYRPDADGAGEPPCLVFLHGGGFVLGDLESHDWLCRVIANFVGTVVAAVDYSLAPEHPFPEALHDTLDVLAWAHASAPELEIDRRRLAVAGDSAGGNLAAAAALALRDQEPHLALQLLVYPMLDDRMSTASHEAHSDTPPLSRGHLRWFWDQYLQGDGSPSALAAPSRADSLARLPPAIVVSAGHDPLADEAEAYARRLEAEGTPVVLIRGGGLVHGFLGTAADDPLAAAAMVATLHAVRRTLHGAG